MTLCERCGFTTDGPLHRDFCPEGAVAKAGGPARTTDELRAAECPFCEVHHDGARCPVEDGGRS